MDLLNLQREMALKRAQIERELGIGLKSKSKSKSKSKRSRSALQKEREEALQAERNAEAAAYAALPKNLSGTRRIRRRAGVNARLSGNPNLLPGAPLRGIQGSIAHVRNLPLRRSRRSHPAKKEKAE